MKHFATENLYFSSLRLLVDSLTELKSSTSHPRRFIDRITIQCYTSILYVCTYSQKDPTEVEESIP